ncbi:hypothetical protein QBC37DRAFT_135467 [Rhypophila decipiens]|uniref:Uncharacterized protein n=1 Tax=Rhypophila decipiens TaxID=261697 RepID=A0AAN7BCZ5_9PEZI|nr:hypothetical protein QBC37DRAFT_135467 [Rhypophila decipiens]
MGWLVGSRVYRRKASKASLVFSPFFGSGFQLPPLLFFFFFFFFSLERFGSTDDWQQGSREKEKASDYFGGFVANIIIRHEERLLSLKNNTHTHSRLSHFLYCSFLSFIFFILLSQHKLDFFLSVFQVSLIRNWHTHSKRAHSLYLPYVYKHPLPLLLAYGSTPTLPVYYLCNNL